jgi:hypothetical protein
MLTANKLIPKYRSHQGVNAGAVLVSPLRKFKEIIEKNVMMVIALDESVSGRRNPDAIVRHRTSSLLFFNEKI